MKPSSVCLPKSDIPLLLAGDMPPDEAAAAESHIAECESCRGTIESMIADSRWWDDARTSLAASHVAASLRDAESFCSVKNCEAEICDEGASLGETRLRDDRLREKLLDLLGPTDDPNMLGRIGPYEVIGLLGQGGMGAVFKGFDRSLNRFVAIKMLLPHLAASGAARKRFAREGQAVAAVVDDHVMAIHCVDEWQGVPYLVMTYSRGVSLQKRLSDNGPLEVREILRIGMQAAKGLAAAHAQGIVHRDIKPANIFLDQNVERVQLMDFGLARAVDDASLTRTGVLAGTPQYMSPEQARAETVDHRSDMFSLGSVLYAMCTGHAPFRAESSYSVLRLITDKEPRPIREINPEIPEWLCAIISKLMAKQADERFDTACEVAEILEECLAHVQQPQAKPLPEKVIALAPKMVRRPPISKFIGAAAFAFSLLFAGVLVVLELNKGTLTIESDAEDVPIRIMQGEKVVERMTVTKAGNSVRVAAGSYLVELDTTMDNMVVENDKVVLGRGSTKRISIRYSPPIDVSNTGDTAVEQTTNANLVITNHFRHGDLEGLRFGERHEPVGNGYWNPNVAEPGESSKLFASFPTLGNGIEEVGLVVYVYPPKDLSGNSMTRSRNYLVQTGSIREIKDMNVRESMCAPKSPYFTPDEEIYVVGYLELQPDAARTSNIALDMRDGLAHVDIVNVVGLPNEQVRKSLNLRSPNDQLEYWLPASLQLRPQSQWASRLMNLNGWEKDPQSRLDHIVQKKVILKPSGTQVLKMEPFEKSEHATLSPTTTPSQVAVSDPQSLEFATKSYNEATAELRRSLFQPPIPDLTIEQVREGFRKAVDLYRRGGKPLVANALQKIVDTNRLPDGIHMFLTGPYAEDDRGGTLTRQIVPGLILPDNTSQGGHLLTPIRPLELLYGKDGKCSKTYGDSDWNTLPAVEKPGSDSMPSDETSDLLRKLEGSWTIESIYSPQSSAEVVPDYAYKDVYVFEKNKVRIERESITVVTGSVELKSKPSLTLTMQFDDKVDSNGKSESHIEGALEFKSKDEFWLAVPDTSVRPSQETLLAGQPRVVWKMRRVVAASPSGKDEAQEVIVLEPNGSVQGHWTTKQGYWIACGYGTALEKVDKRDPGILAVRLGIVHGGPLHPGPSAVSADDLQIISQMWLVIREDDKVISRAKLDRELDHGNEEHYIATINAMADLVPKMEIEFEERSKSGMRRFRIPVRTFIKEP